MTDPDYLLLAAILAGAALIYFVDDGRIRVGVLAAFGALVYWRRNHPDSSNHSNSSNSSLNPTPPDTTEVDHDAQATDARIDAIAHDRPTDPDVRTGLDLLRKRDRERRAARGDR